MMTYWQWVVITPEKEIGDLFSSFAPAPPDSLLLVQDGQVSPDSLLLVQDGQVSPDSLLLVQDGEVAEVGHGCSFRRHLWLGLDDLVGQLEADGAEQVSLAVLEGISFTCKS